MKLPSVHRGMALQSFPEGMPFADIPALVTGAYFIEQGYISPHDLEIRSVLVFLGFVDEAGGPTPLWQDYATGGVRVLRDAVEKYYRDLFENHPPVDPIDTEESLQKWLTETLLLTKTGSARAAKTLHLLCRVAGTSLDTILSQAARIEVDEGVAAARSPTQPTDAVTYILPATRDALVYEAIFRAHRNVLDRRSRVDIAGAWPPALCIAAAHRGHRVLCDTATGLTSPGPCPPPAAEAQ